MKKHLLFILGFWVLSGVQLNVQAANDKAFFWEVRSDKTTVYLMGSIHFADESFYPLRSEIEEAFKRSDYLVVELDISNTNQQVYHQILAEKGVYKNGTTIKDVISDETWRQLRQQLRQLKIDYETVKNYKPGILVLTLTTMQVMQMGFDPKLGLDAHFLTMASAGEPFDSASVKSALAGSEAEKPIIELETLEQQLNLFLDIPNGDLLLQESLYSLNESEQLMAEVVRLWKQGDEAGMNKLLFEDVMNEYPAFSKIYDSLIYQRNRQMTEKIETMLAKRETYFVVVGSGHMIGEKGIANVLKEKGYEVKRR